MEVEKHNPNGHTHLLCSREGCTTNRHSRVNQYCKKHRAAYQKALRIVKKSYVTDPESEDKRKGRPWRPMDEDVAYFINKITNKQP